MTKSNLFKVCVFDSGDIGIIPATTTNYWNDVADFSDYKKNVHYKFMVVRKNKITATIKKIKKRYMEQTFNWIMSCIASSTNSFQFDCCNTLISLFETKYKGCERIRQKVDELGLALDNHRLLQSVSA